MRVCLVSGFAEQLYSLCAHDEEALTLLRILDLASQDLRGDVTPPAYSITIDLRNVLAALTDVRSWGKSGRDLPVLSVFSI